MTQNVSTAVMQRRVEAHDSLEDFPTPPWATRAICERLAISGFINFDMSCREPCANRGYMVRPLLDYFSIVDASDVHDYGCGFPVADYLWGEDPEPIDWTFLNPPFRLAQQFIQRAIRTSRAGVAAIVRCAFTEGGARYADLFEPHPPSFVIQHCERVPMVKGRYDPKATTATAYAWLVWMPGQTDTRFRWIAPSRKQFERAEDYLSEQAA